MEHPSITHVKVYKDDAGEWRFTAYASNGAAIAVASEGYENHLDAVGAATGAFPAAEIEDTTEGGNT